MNLWLMVMFVCYELDGLVSAFHASYSLMKPELTRIFDKRVSPSRIRHHSRRHKRSWPVESKFSEYPMPMYMAMQSDADQCNDHFFAKLGHPMVSCPSVDPNKPRRCILQQELCNSYADCPGGEDEDHMFCMFKALDDSEVRELTSSYHSYAHPLAHSKSNKHRILRTKAEETEKALRALISSKARYQTKLLELVKMRKLGQRRQVVAKELNLALELESHRIDRVQHYGLIHDSVEIEPTPQEEPVWEHQEEPVSPSLAEMLAKSRTTPTSTTTTATTTEDEYIMYDDEDTGEDHTKGQKLIESLRENDAEKKSDHIRPAHDRHS